MRDSRAAAAAALVAVLGAPTAAHGGVIPAPAQIVLGAGSFSIGPGTLLDVPPGDPDASAAARYLAELWTRTNGLTLTVRSRAARHASALGAPPGVGVPLDAGMPLDVIDFRRAPGLGPEDYGIDVAEHRITVSAGTAAGLLYGAVTLWQLLPPEVAAGKIPVQHIRDTPAYSWRGLMLDSARHFQSPAFVKSMIDWMAWHKLNVLHWHLTDDQGWRIEIRRYPRLTSVGGWRIEPDGARYGGFYSQREVRDIVRFAAARHVRIVPEIDMPGHATAAIASYPWLGVAADAGSAGPNAPAAPAGPAALAGPAAPAVSATWGVHTHLFNLDAHTLRFLENVLAEVIELFPSPVIHIGGDEAVKDEWNTSPAVRARARELGLQDADALQAYFTAQMSRYLAAHGRRIVGWDEILRPGLARSAIVMSWHGVSGAHTAALAGNDTVLSPDPALYFDHRQSTLPSEPPGRLSVISLEDVYRFDPVDATLTAAQRRHVLGLQANLWTEHMQTEARVQWMALPRAAALAEVGWSPPGRRRWPDFLERLAPMFARYRAFGLNYADSVFAPDARILRRPGGYSVAFTNQAEVDAPGVSLLRYTLDGGEPGPRSMRYAEPLTLTDGTEVSAAAFAGAQRVSTVWRKHLDAQTALRRDSHDLTLCSSSVGLLLEPAAAHAPLAIDILNPCWIDRDVDLSAGAQLTAAVAPLPFNFEVGAAAAGIRTGDARSARGELEIHLDDCAAPVLAVIPLASAAASGVTILPALTLPRLEGRHDLCLRFARPHLDPQWALDWIELREAAPNVDP